MLPGRCVKRGSCREGVLCEGTVAAAVPTVAQRIRTRRLELGLSLRAAACEGVSAAYISRLEHGERRRQAGQQSHRPEVHVLVEALPEGQNQLPHRHVIGDTRRADRPEVNGVERR